MYIYIYRRPRDCEKLTFFLSSGALASSAELGECRDSQGRTALHAAAFCGACKVLDVLLASDACERATDEADPLDCADAQGLTALMVAARRGAADCVRALMRAGCDAGLLCDPLAVCENTDAAAGQMGCAAQHHQQQACCAVLVTAGRTARELARGPQRVCFASPNARGGSHHFKNGLHILVQF